MLNSCLPLVVTSIKPYSESLMCTGPIWIGSSSFSSGLAVMMYYSFPSLQEYRIATLILKVSLRR